MEELGQGAGPEGQRILWGGGRAIFPLARLLSHRVRENRQELDAGCASVLPLLASFPFS